MFRLVNAFSVGILVGWVAGIDIGVGVDIHKVIGNVVFGLRVIWGP
jgi:hypothetical protein